MSIFLVFAVLALLIFFVLRTNSLSEKIIMMEWEIKKLRYELEQYTKGLTKATPHEAAEQKPSTSPSPATTIVPEIRPPQPATVPTMVPLSPAPVHPIKPSKTKEEWESFVGGKLLNRVGALALIIGVAFFLQYAFERNWISETVRVLIGAATGIGLLLGAYRTWKKGFHIFAQGLVGAGIAILYLSIYASFNYYHLVSQPVAFVLMSLITAGTFLLALRYNSIAVSILGWFGGFLTPIILSTGSANEIGLFTYVALLDVGILAVLLMNERWFLLEPLSLLGTYILYFAWYIKYYPSAISSGFVRSVPPELYSAIFFLFVFWLIFFGVEFWRNLKNRLISVELRSVQSAFSACLFYLFLYSAISPYYPHLMGMITLLVGLVYFSSSMMLSMRIDAKGIGISQNIITAILFAIVATIIEFEGYSKIIFFSGEALALILSAQLWNRRYLRMIGFGLYCITFLLLLISQLDSTPNGILLSVPLFNHRTLAFLTFIFSAYTASSFSAGEDQKTTVRITSAYHYMWGGILLLLCLLETYDYFIPPYQPMMERSEHILRTFHFDLSFAFVCILYSFFTLWIGIKNQLSALLHWSIAGFVIGAWMMIIGGASYVPIDHFMLVFNIRVGGMLLITCSSAVILMYLRQYGDHPEWLRYFQQLVTIAIVVLIFTLLTGETIDFFRKKMLAPQSYEMKEQTINAMQMSLSLVWLLYSIALMIVGIWKRTRGMRIISIVVFSVTILKIFIYDLSFLQTLYRIFSFIVLGIILLGVSYLYQRYKGIIFNKEEGSSGGEVL